MLSCEIGFLIAAAANKLLISFYVCHIGDREKKFDTAFSQKTIITVNYFQTKTIFFLNKNLIGDVI